MLNVKKSIVSMAGAALAFCASANAATLVGVTGELFNADTPIVNLAEADAVILAANGIADATWDVTGIDYPGNSVALTNGLTLSTFVGPDAGSLVGDGTTTLEQSVFRFTGQIQIDGTESVFSVSSDDGFILRIDGATISFHDGQRGFAATDAIPSLSAGLFDFELIYFENAGDTGVTFAVDGVIVEGVPAPVPVPAAAVFMVMGLGAAGAARRRLRK